MSQPQKIVEQSIPDKRPVIPKGSHPVETGRYLLSTNEIERFYKKIEQCLNNRFPGAIIFGRPRLGKTRAVQFLAYILPNEFPNLPIYFIKCRSYKNPNEAIFFEDILRDVNHSVVFSGKANIKRDRLLKFLLEKADLSGQKRVVFFIDDAQRLHELQYGWLMDIYNELDSLGVSLTVFLVGQKELGDQRSVFLNLDKHQIIGRFMVQQYKFKGILKEEDLYECILGYDEKQYPENSGFSFTRFYFPSAHDNGFRLVNYTDDLFNIFKELRQRAGLNSGFEVPMQYFTSTIEYALKNYGIQGKNLTNISKNQWIEAIEYSGYIDSEIYQTKPMRNA